MCLVVLALLLLALTPVVIRQGVPRFLAYGVGALALAVTVQSSVRLWRLCHSQIHLETELNIFAPEFATDLTIPPGSSVLWVTLSGIMRDLAVEISISAPNAAAVPVAFITRGAGKSGWGRRTKVLKIEHSGEAAENGALKLRFITPGREMAERGLSARLLLCSPRVERVQNGPSRVGALSG